MEVRPGYKRTEVGVIPEEWGLEFIENLAHITTGSRNTQDRLDDGEYPFFVRSQTVERINSYSFDGEAVLTAGDGVGTGKVFHYINGKFDAHQRVYRISDFSERINGYFFYLYFSGHFYGRIMQMTAKSSVDSVRREMIARMLIPLPPTKAEQEAIAEALSDADALIGSLEQLLTKKQQLKQGAMQELLTGKKRLPGFSGEWEVVNLDNVVNRITGVWGANDPSPEHPRCADVIRAGDITQDGILTGSAQRFVSDSELSKAHCRLDDIVITTSGNGLGKVWWCDGRPNVAASNFVRILRPIRGRSQGRYLSYVLRSEAGLKQLQEHTATSAYPNLRPSFFAAAWISLPPMSEQAGIADILSAMDAEIAALEARLAKTRQLKQGMMQELLTGRIRLV